jgi:hypothetical protein
VIAACDEGQLSLEVPGLGHGLFTHHLLRGMEGDADHDGDGNVGIDELFVHVSKAVERDAVQKYKVKQRPWYNLTGTGRVYLSSPRRPSRTPASLFADARPPAEAPAEAVAREFHRRFTAADEAELIVGLQRLKTLDGPARLPAVFR